jgi:hypothetical protein
MLVPHVTNRPSRLNFLLVRVVRLKMSSVSQWIACVLKQIMTASLQILPHLHFTILSHHIWFYAKYCCWKWVSKYQESGQAMCTVFVSAAYGFTSWHTSDIQFLCRRITQYDPRICYFVFPFADFASKTSTQSQKWNGTWQHFLIPSYLKLFSVLH